jgi:uncharacterized protein YheU (UPF0270 family)
MIIPYEQLSDETLDNIIEAFVLREGTDYGDVEYTLAQKVEHVKRQLASGEAIVEYSEEHESVTLIAR